jgi:hypothetical protein
MSLAIVSEAQYDPNYKKNSENYSLGDEEPSLVNLGFGLGRDYGGIGVKLSVFPSQVVGIFGGLGYNFLKAGYNVGGIIRILPKQKICPLVTAMYGYTDAINIQGADHYNKVYYGPTFGGGMEIRFRNNQNYLNLETLIPVRSNQFWADMETIQNDPMIELYNEPLPISISVGYHIKI